MSSSKKYILIHEGHTVAFDDEKCYLNDKHFVIDNSTKESNEIATDLKQSFYHKFFKKHFKNIIVLTAAGTSMDNGANRGKSRKGLWDECKDEIDIVHDQCPNIKLKGFDKNYDIEGFLTALILHERVNNEVLDSDSNKIISKIEKKIAKACSLNLCKAQAPHLEFLNKLTARKINAPRLQLFTTNYDTLFEQAANEGGFVIIDGFSFTQPRKFSGRFYDIDIVNREKSRITQEESFIPRVFQLYKIHGSLNWGRIDGDVVLQENPTSPLIVYPASEKYESSYEQPFFEMMSRFQQALRKENTLLIVIGFGFQDKHIQNVIKEAVNQNSNFHLVIIYYGLDENGDEIGIQTDYIIDYFKDIGTFSPKSNVTIIFDTFNGFTKNYPLNSTYFNLKEDESI
ncbi:SIR2 family protein [Dysgonomonas sp. GY75]|uniref:SIR2 family protein n=1 Tax=Dysgonomonas sp. GY75 TaxID=2780419 RepID=UPI00188420F5|nr:SIR2 family protein [Dysgonomonas sp. GY75]MBF0651347.1 SIR2 family protein [Dysgonomonas sp. GY75]